MCHQPGCTASQPRHAWACLPAAADAHCRSQMLPRRHRGPPIPPQPPHGCPPGSLSWRSAAVTVSVDSRVSPGTPRWVKNTTGTRERTRSGPPGGGPTSRGTAEEGEGSGTGLIGWQCKQAGMRSRGCTLHLLQPVLLCCCLHHTLTVNATALHLRGASSAPARRRTTRAGQNSWPSTRAHTMRPGGYRSPGPWNSSPSSPCRRAGRYAVGQSSTGACTTWWIG